jgi:hypothetical protein
MNFKGIIVLASCLFITSTLHAQTSYKKCPEVTAVQNVMSHFKVRKYAANNNVWYAYQNNNFKTKNTWTFMINEVHANNEDEARGKFIDSLKGLRFIKGADSADGSMSCYYNAAEGLKATAKTPSFLPD